MHFIILSGLSGVVLLLASLALLAVGRRIGKRRLEQDPSGGCAGHSAVEAAVFGLLGLLLAFTFSGALTRFDERRQLIADEANASLRPIGRPICCNPMVAPLFAGGCDST